MKLSKAKALAEQVIYDYTSSTKWQQVKYMTWTTAEMQDVIAKALVKNIEAIKYCMNKDLEKHPIEGVNETMKIDRNIKEVQFYCNQDDGEYNNNPCDEQCKFCKGVESL